MWPVFTGIAALVIGLSCGSAMPVFDLSPFEETVLPKWMDQFKVGDTPGAFSYLAGGTSVNFYGAADMAHLLDTVGQLDVLSESVRRDWASTVLSFQNKTTGFFRLTLAEQQCGFQPWHSTGFAVSALSILQRNSTQPRLYPAPIPMYSSIAESNATTWTDVFLPLIQGDAPGCDNVHSCGHKLVAIPAFLALGSPDVTSFNPFLSWWKDLVVQHVNASTGTPCPPDAHAQDCVGGGAAIHFALTALDVDWPIPAVVRDFTWFARNKTTNRWKPQLDTYSNFDGVYQTVFPGPNVPNWQFAMEACQTYLNYTVPVLNSWPATELTFLLSGTHNLPGAVAGVGVCAKYFPSIVKTARPWGCCAPFP